MPETWLIIHMLDGSVHVWDLGEIDPTDLEAASVAARTAVGFQADDQWPHEDGPAAVMVSYGEPHHTLMERATVHHRSELSKVDAAAVATYQAELERVRQTALVDTFATTLAGLDPAVLAAILAHPAVAPAAIELARS
jgi:hypothetical protein